MLLSADTMELHGEAHILTTMLDITERKRIEQTLAYERDQLQALTDNVPDTIYFKDRASRFTRINLAQARRLGVATPELAVGKTDADFQPSDMSAEFYAEEQRLLDIGEPLVDRLEFNPTPSGKPRWLSATKVPLKDASGVVVGLVGISRDGFRQMKFGFASDPSGPITLSLGVAAYPQHGEVMEAVLRAADAALYQAKSGGRDQTFVGPG